MRSIIIIVISLTLLAGCTEQKQDENEPIIMSVKQLSEQIRGTEDNVTHAYSVVFKTLQPGDVLILKDIIADKQYSEGTVIGNATLLLFSSDPKNGFYFQGDLIDFMINDSVEITLHISRDVFQKAVGETNWTFDVELFTEGWNFETHDAMALPSTTIRKV